MARASERAKARRGESGHWLCLESCPASSGTTTTTTVGLGASRVDLWLVVLCCLSAALLWRFVSSWIAAAVEPTTPRQSIQLGGTTHTWQEDTIALLAPAARTRWLGWRIDVAEVALCLAQSAVDLEASVWRSSSRSSARTGSALRGILLPTYTSPVAAFWDPLLLFTFRRRRAAAAGRGTRPGRSRRPRRGAGRPTVARARHEQVVHRCPRGRGEPRRGVREAHGCDAAMDVSVKREDETPATRSRSLEWGPWAGPVGLRKVNYHNAFSVLRGTSC